MDALLVFITLAIAMGVIARQLAVTRRDLRDVREQLARQQRDIEHLRPERPPQVGRSTSGKPPPPKPPLRR